MCFVVMGLLSYLPLLPAEHAAAATQPANHPAAASLEKTGSQPHPGSRSCSLLISSVRLAGGLVR